MKEQLHINFTSVIIDIITNYWFLLPVLIGFLSLKKFFKSSTFKGWAGELEIRLIYWFFLDKKIYRKFYNITVKKFDGGSTQIDYIIASIYGIFVIEIKTMNGWIYGEENDENWKWKFFKKEGQFQSPILQNKNHIKTLSEILKFPEEKFISIIALTGKFTPKTKMPHYVLFKHYASYIKNKTKRILTEKEVTNIIEGIKAYQLPKTFKTRREHNEYVKSIKENIRTNN